MSDKPKATAGLFRLDELDPVDTPETEAAESRPAAEPSGPQPIAPPGSSMLDAIRRARAAQPEAVASIDEIPVQRVKLRPPPPPPPTEKPEPVADESETKPSSGFKTDDHLALAEAMAKDQSRTSRRTLVYITIAMLLVAGGLSALLFFVLQPPVIMSDHLPTYTPNVVSHTSDLNQVDIAMIPIAEPEPVEEVRPRERRRRDRSRRSRDRNRGSSVNRADLF